MNNNECNVARDLMPLVIDQVASEESRTLVETHAAACESCAQVYNDMLTQTPEKSDAAEDNSFSAAMRQLRRTVGWRRIKVIILSVVITLCVLATGLWVNQILYIDDNRDMPLDWYNVTISRAKDGEGIITYDFLSAVGSYEFYADTSSGIIVLGSKCPYIASRLEDGRIYHGLPGQVGICWKDGVGFVFKVDESQRNTTDAIVKEIRMGTKKEYKILYQQGNDVPLCSEKMEATFLLKKKCTDAYIALNKVEEELAALYNSMDTE